MQERDTLLSTLPPDVRPEGERLYDEAGRTLHDDPDPRDIVAELHRRGLLDKRQLREAVLALESTLRIRRVNPKLPEDSSAEPEILGVLGAGAMGEVLIAKDPGLGRVYAMKRLHPDAAGRRTMLRRFYVEAQITAQLDHPSIVPIHGLIRDEKGLLGYSMKLVRGRTLADYLEDLKGGSREDEHNVLPARLERFLHVCDALAYAHDRGVIHRDLKPDNIMVGAFGEVIVMDWGIAKVLESPVDEAAAPEEGPVDPAAEGAASPSETPLPADGTAGARTRGGRGTKGTNRGTSGTRVGTVMGTPRYMSPEQAEGRTDELDPRSDQYALGSILYELVTLQPAVPSDLGLDETLAWAKAARKQPYPRGTPRELCAIVDKAMSRLPGQRYPGVADLAEDVRRYLRDEAVTARPDGLIQRVQRWVGRHRQATLGLIFTLLLGSVTVAAGLLVTGLVAVEYVRYQAQLREAMLVRVSRYAGERVHGLDMELRRVEGLVGSLAIAAERAMEGPLPVLPYDVSHAPPELRKSSIYGRSISAEWPELVTRLGAEAPTDDLVRLASLGPVMAQVLVESRRGLGARLKDREAFELIAEKGVPVAYARVSLQGSGASARFPGSSGPRAAPDPRSADWYGAPKGKKGAAWTGPVVDPDGAGLVMTCSLPVFAGSRLLGVAAVDVRLGAILEELTIRGADGARDGYLLDDGGMVVASTLQPDPAKAKEYAPAPFPHPSVWDAIRASPANGFLELEDEVAVWSQARVLGLTYVVVAPSDALQRPESRESP